MKINIMVLGCDKGFCQRQAFLRHVKTHNQDKLEKQEKHEKQEKQEKQENQEKNK